MALSYDGIVQLLKSKNYRITEIRLAIIKILSEKQHLTLTEIVTLLEKEFKNVNLMSVYNTIDLLISEHIVFTNSFDGKQIWYDLAENPSFHMVCDICKNVVHIKDTNILQEIKLDNLKEVMTNINWEPVHFKIEGHGICDQCHNKKYEPLQFEEHSNEENK
ncbi:Fur family transcriptional regulator [Spiroplasma melliferum]|uniref:Fur family transcriptional regulator n=2 Tax=Spiroplasma melliferum TaxID=2134 RepID=A0AAI9T3M1_SPIME|nr:transcriptional repressor [Spiroplasma melliferum]ELL44812.1 Fur family transcriptional regulator [Spiroplasma melliferum IPMB4A]KAI92779.1 Fur family transcriptional regulator [Spiroplasma melliferum KC3]QCO24409.1 Fur family transcriptional regulator [Spiroplasma melliferum]